MKDLIERLRASGVHTLLAQFTDMHGVAKGKLVPLAHFDELLTDGAGFAGPSICGHRPAAHRPARRVLRPRRRQHRRRPALDARRGAHRLRRLRRRRALRRLPAPGAQARRGAPGRARLARCAPASSPSSSCSSATASAGCRPMPQDRLDKPSYDLKSLPRQQGFLHELQSALLEAAGWTCCRSTTRTRTASTS